MSEPPLPEEIKRIQIQMQSEVFDKLDLGMNVQNAPTTGAGKDYMTAHYIHNHPGETFLILCTTYEVCEAQTIEQDKLNLEYFLIRSRWASRPDTVKADKEDMCQRDKSERSFPGCELDVTEYSPKELSAIQPYVQNDYRLKKSKLKAKIVRGMEESTELVWTKDRSGKWIQNRKRGEIVDIPVESTPCVYQCSFYKICDYQRQIKQFSKALKNAFRYGELGLSVITTVEMGPMIADMILGNGLLIDLVIFSESFEDKLLRVCNFGWDAEGNEQPLRLYPEDLIRFGIGFKSHINAIRWRSKQDPGDKNEYDLVDYASINVRVLSPKSHALKAFFSSVDSTCVYAQQESYVDRKTLEEKYYYILFGKWDHYLPNLADHTSWLWNSATSSPDLTAFLKQTSINTFTYFSPPFQCQNPVLRVKWEAYIDKTETILSALIFLIQGLVDLGKKIGVCTKLMFEKRIQMYIRIPKGGKPVQYAHYKQSGSNALNQEFDLIVFICGYADKPEVQRKLGLIGFSQRMVHDLAFSTSRQGFGRFRLFGWHPHTPVLAILPESDLRDFNPERVVSVCKDAFVSYGVTDTSPQRKINDDRRKIKRFINDHVMHETEITRKIRIETFITHECSNDEIMAQIECTPQYINRIRQQLRDSDSN